MNHHISLSGRLKLLTALWVTAALVSIAFTLVLSWRMEGAGAAINDAGSLRMRTYLMAFKLTEQPPVNTIETDIREFDRILANLQSGDPKRPLFLPSSEDVAQQMAQIVNHWQHHTRPMLASAETNRSALHQTLQNFVAQIDKLVLLAERENARNTEWLRLFQTGLMVMVLLGAAVMVVLLYAWVILPINNLSAGVNAIREGRFGKKVAVGNVTEFAQLAVGFNQMSTHLQKLYSSLEQKVAQKTHDLARKNHELETLYQTTRQLHQTRTAAEAAQDFLNCVLPQTSAAAGSVRLLDFTRSRMDLAASKGLPENLRTAEQCERLEACFCGHAANNQTGEHIVHFFHDEPPETVNFCEKAGFKDLAVFHVRHKDQEIGIFTLYFNEQSSLEAAESELLNTLCDQLGLAIANIRLIEENRQLAVLQERNLLAQGLHDSIAQTLTFLNLQVQMLESAMKTGQLEQIEENMNFIKEGVQECYDDVRELLLNFRTKVSRKDFTEAVETLTRRFTQQTHIPVEVKWSGHGLPLSPEQQLQVIFILQESLSNIRKHARADHVEISLQNHQDFILSIRDNGIGFGTERLAAMSSSHVGIGIMHERARRIHAELGITSAPEQGTTITLTLHENKRAAT